MSGYAALRPLLFRLEAERAHTCVLHAVEALDRVPGFAAATGALYGWEHPLLRQHLWGREVANPIGVAAGFDKDGRLVRPLMQLGFGLVEAGTVTPKPQPGNERPRLFRLPDNEALINRMGFNNAGAAALANRLAGAFRRTALVGVNLGKNKDTPLASAAADYVAALQSVYGRADYLVVNVSSPNTPGLRDLQAERALTDVVAPLCEAREQQVAAGAPRVPLLVKVAPDLDEVGLAAAAAVTRKHGLDGIIATNTTLQRPPELRGRHRAEAGGLSGPPLRERALTVVASLRRHTAGEVPLIGVGGIATAADAYRFIRAGASAVQVYTALVYHGPGLARHLKQGLVRLLLRDGFASVAEAVGVDVPLGK